jgi:hypothetical protein
MNMVKDFTKTFPSWRNGSWEDGTVGCLQNMFVYNERNPRQWLRKKKITKGILKLSTCKVICVQPVKFLCINK